MAPFPPAAPFAEGCGRACPGQNGRGSVCYLYCNTFIRETQAKSRAEKVIHSSRKSRHCPHPRASPRGVTEKKANAPLPSAAPPPSPKGEGKTFVIPNKYSKKGKITLFPFFPYEHTDEGECAARLIKGVPCNARRRGEKPPPARRVILRDERMAGFPLSLDDLF